MTRDRGFVLVNALLLVAVLSLAAVALLSRAEGGRQRLGGAQEAATVSLGLDGFETLAITLLDDDRRGPAGPDVDHPGEDWARTGMRFALPRGEVAGRITDMQSLFNLNWLADPEDIQAEAAFGRLARGLGLAPQTAQRIVAFLRPGGPSDLRPYAQRDPASRPVGGPVLMLAQIGEVAGVSAADLERLARSATALDASTTLNVNTASAAVLRAVLPERLHAGLAAVLAARARSPFDSVDAFLEALGEPVSSASSETEAAADSDAASGSEATAQATPDAVAPDPVPAGRLSVGSRWFRADMEIVLPERRQRRVAVLERSPLPQGTRVAWRLTPAP